VPEPSSLAVAIGLLFATAHRPSRTRSALNRRASSI
jgi:hypothetical protein